MYLHGLMPFKGFAIMAMVVVKPVIGVFVDGTNPFISITHALKWNNCG